MILKLFCVILILQNSYSEVCDKRLSILLNNGVKDGDKIIYENITYNKDQYYEVEKNNVTWYWGCPCKIKKCYRKCCQKGKLIKDNQCVPSNKSSMYYDEIQIYKNKEPLNVSVEENFVEIPSISCPSGQVQVLEPDKDAEIYLQENGSLLYTTAGYDFWETTEKFCMEKYDDDDFQVLTALICNDKVVDQDTTTATAYGAFLIIVLPFYLALFLVYTLIKELRNFHGLCLANYSICLFIAFLSLVIIYLGTKSLLSKYVSLCISIGIIVYVAFMASFLWLNVMGIDLWLTFRSRASYNSISKRKKIMYYSIYAWGIAGILLIVITFLQFQGQKYFPNAVLPKIGVTSCWFPDDKTRGYYVYGPMMFMIITNIVMFILTAINIWQAKRETKKSMKKESKMHSTCDRQRFLLYLKLFLAFGVNWSFELIPWLFGTRQIFQGLLDIFNILYGIVVFIITICSKNVLKVLRDRLAKVPSLSAFYHSNPSTATTSTATS